MSTVSREGAVRIAIVATAALTLRSFLIPYAVHLRARGWQVHGIAADAEDCDVCRQAFDHVHNVSWSRSPLDVRGLGVGYKSISALAKTWHFDLVHVHTPIAAFLTRMALRRCRYPMRVIYTAHGFHFHAGGGRVANALFRLLERIAGRWTDRLIVINQDDQRAALDARIVPRERLRLMPGIGIDLRAFTAAADESGGEFPNGSGGFVTEPVFLMVGEFNPGKRHEDVVAALALLDRSDVHVAFAGVGPERERVRGLAAGLGLSDRVHFLGYRRDIVALLRAATGFILCSAREGLPMSMMEAMAAGTPVIGTDIRGIRDLIGGGAGMLVPVGDPPAIANAMRRILGEPGLASELVANARRSIQGYSIDRLLSMHDTLYDELLGEGGS